MFNGQNILPDFPEGLTKVIAYLNEKAQNGEFVFSDSIREWEKNERIIDPVGLGSDGDGYYFAIALAYLANINNGILDFPDGTHIWRWAWSLQILAEVACWDAEFIERVIRSFLGKKKEIDGLISNAAQTYARKDYDNGVELRKRLTEFRNYIAAGLMENDFSRYCDEFLPQENQDEFTAAYVVAYALQEKEHERAFDMALSFEAFDSAEAMAFLLKAYINLTDKRKDICANRIRDILKNGRTYQYVTPVCNWIVRSREHDSFTEEVVLMLIEGLGADNSEQLGAIDYALGLRDKNPESLIKILDKIADSFSPMTVVKMEHVLNRLNDNRNLFSELAVMFIIHPKGEYRLVGRRLWDQFRLESTEFDATELPEVAQCFFAYSMLQDFGNPETRLPKVLPLLRKGNPKVKEFVMRTLRRYTDDYMGHVVEAINEQKIKGKIAQTIKGYVDGRWNVIKLRRETKELSPAYAYGKEYREARRIETEYLQGRMKEAEKNHHAVWKEIASTVILARGGGWRMADGRTQKLPLIQFSAPARQLNESLSPKEQENWLKDIMRNWNDETGNN